MSDRCQCSSDCELWVLEDGESYDDDDGFWGFGGDDPDDDWDGHVVDRGE